MRVCSETVKKKKHKDVNTQKNTFICSVFFLFFFWVKPEFFSASFDQFLVQSVETRALRLDLFKVVPHLVPPLHLRRQRQSKTHWLRAFERSKIRGVDWFSFICHKILLCNYNRFFFELHLIFVFFFLIFGIFMYKDTFNICLKTFSPDFIQYCAFIWTISLSWSIKFTQEQQHEPSRCNLAF